MHPILLEINFFDTIYRFPSYGVMISIAFTFSYLVALCNGLKLGMKFVDIERLFLLTLFSSFIGARLYHVFVEDWSYYQNHLNEIHIFWQGGYTLYGGIIAAIFLGLLYAVNYRVPVKNGLDVTATCLSLGIFFGRIGCFMAGCCWGKTCEYPWAVSFSHPLAFTTTKHTPIHPTQLYEAIGSLAIFIFLQSRLKRRNFEGELFSYWLISYGLLRYFGEIFRDPHIRGIFIEKYLSHSQFLSIILVLIGVCLLRLLKKKK